MTMSSCIDEKMLARYIGATLPEAERTAVEDHLASCPACRQDFVAARILLADDTLPDLEPIEESAAHALFETLKKNLTRFYEWIRTPVEPGLRFAPVRSGETATPDHICFSRELDGLDIEIRFEKKETDSASMMVRLLKSDDKKNIRITLIDADNSITSRILKDGFNIFESLDFGRYHLNFSQNSNDKGNIFFAISESGIHEKSGRYS